MPSKSIADAVEYYKFQYIPDFLSRNNPPYHKTDHLRAIFLKISRLKHSAKRPKMAFFLPKKRAVRQRERQFATLYLFHACTPPPSRPPKTLFKISKNPPILAWECIGLNSIAERLVVASFGWRDGGFLQLIDINVGGFRLKKGQRTLHPRFRCIRAKELTRGNFLILGGIFLSWPVQTNF